MNRTLKRTSLVAMATVAASVINAALFAPTASATENTWIENRGYQNFCVTSTGGGGIFGDTCRFGDRTQLWDRKGSNIVRAYTNQCLDSNSDGVVYYLECNGGDYQKWYFITNGGAVSVQNVATHKYLNFQVATRRIYTLVTPANGSSWDFFGGE